MILATLAKQPGETIRRIIDFSAWLGTGEALISCVADISPSGELSEAGLAVDTSAGTVAVYLSGGTDGSEYLVTLTTTTDSSPARIREDELVVNVEEITQ